MKVAPGDISIVSIGAGGENEMASRQVLDQNITFTTASNVPINSTLRFDTADALAVNFMFGGQVNWVIGRDLLISAFAEVAGFVGEGDVGCFLRDDRFFMNLSSPDGSVSLSCSADQMRSFLDLATDLVPQGEEFNDIDMTSVIQQLLS